MPKIIQFYIGLSLIALLGCENFGPEEPMEFELLDGPLDGLSVSEQQRFLAGDIAFNDDVFTVEKGLGPLFVGTSCASCHSGDGKGHPFNQLIRFGNNDLTIPSMLSFGDGRNQIQNKAIPGFEPETVPEGFPFSILVAPAVTGLGLLDAVSDADILAHADPSDENQDGISGRPHYNIPPEFTKIRNNSVPQGNNYIFRFGKKAGSYDLLHQSVSAYNQIKSKQNDAIDFEQMGFEHIMVDESHKFKNLMYTTRHHRVAGLNTNKGSERSKNLLVAIRTLQRAKTRDFQTTFLSGTPISNSITEVYVLFKYLIPHRMEQMNITSFDQWAQVFANKSYEFEPTVSGDYKVRERFRSFKKMKLLSSLYNEISIIVNGTTHQIDRPKMQLDVHTLKPTAAQLEYFEQIKEFLRTGDSSLLYGDKDYTEDQKSALSLIALHHMRNASIDPRMLNQNLEDPGDAKLQKIASEVYDTYRKTDAFKGTQAIFSDLGVPKDTFNIYDELKRILTEEFDIPKEEVVFIHDFKTDNKRLECFKQVNEGTYRVIIGSTEKLGTGTNIQERLVRIHHVDIPYRPTDIDQRNGRGVRKGNIGAKQHFGDKVVVSFYIVENCTDALMLNNVNIKKNFIEQLTNGTIQFNRLDMGAVNDEGTIDYKTLLAVAKNDPLYLEKEELGKELDELELERSIFKKNRLEAKNNIAFYETELTRTTKNIDKLEKDLSLWTTLQEKDVYYSALGKALDSPDTMDANMLGQILNSRLQAKREEVGQHTIMTISNARLVLDVEDKLHHRLLVLTPNASYGYGSKRIVANWQSLTDYVYNALSKIPKSLLAQKEHLAEYKKSIKANRKVLELEFDKTEKLALVQKRLVEINTDLDEKYDAEPEEKEEKCNSQSARSQNINMNQEISM